MTDSNDVTNDNRIFNVRGRNEQSWATWADGRDLTNWSWWVKVWKRWSKLTDEVLMAENGWRWGWRRWWWMMGERNLLMVMDWCWWWNELRINWCCCDGSWWRRKDLTTAIAREMMREGSMSWCCSHPDWFPLSSVTVVFSLARTRHCYLREVSDILPNMFPQLVITQIMTKNK